MAPLMTTAKLIERWAKYLEFPNNSEILFVPTKTFFWLCLSLKSDFRQADAILKFMKFCVVATFSTNPLNRNVSGMNKTL